MTRRMRAPSMIPVAKLAMTRAEQQFVDWGLSIPVRVDMIFEIFNANLEFGKLPEACPEVTWVDRDGSKLVVIRREDPVSRQRFSAAHSLGHLELHQGRSVCVPGEKQFVDRIRETEANAFAAALLMPKKHFVTRLAQFRAPEAMDLNALVHLDEDMKGLTNLALRFGVSRQAVFYRLNDLSLLTEGVTLDEFDEALMQYRHSKRKVVLMPGLDRGSHAASSNDDELEPYGDVEDEPVPF